MKSIDINEVHARVLGIAKEFDKICTRHNIPYYMLGGTMLGAIRHKGFIPWDDDMDFGVPYEYFDTIEEILEKELPYPYRCCTYKNHPAALDNFIKIDDQTTRIDDKAINLPLDKKLGVNIDVFPLVRCQKEDFSMDIIKWKRRLLGSFYLSKSHPNSILRKILKKILQVISGGKPIYLQKSIDKTLSNLHDGDCWGNLLGHWQEREIIPIDWYGEGTRYTFEDTTFVGIKLYDEYLKQLYGDYMKLPPVEKRTAHVIDTYLYNLN